MNRKITSLLVFALLFIFFNCSHRITCDKSNFDTKKLEIICKVWGFLKYYHPGAGNVNQNWDKKLLTTLKDADTVLNKTELNVLISWMIDRCNEYKEIIPDTHYLSGKLLKENDISWLSDTAYLSYDNSCKLLSFYKNKTPYINKYVSQYYDVGNLSFENEDPYADSLFPSKNLRLLSLFRFWNIIRYFYPYLEINDIEWDAVLTQYIPEFIHLEDTTEYHLKVRELACELNDGHIWIDRSVPLAKYKGFFNPPYKLKYIEGKPVVFELFSDSLGALQDLRLGDQILEINNVSVEKLFNERGKYYSFSNIDHFNRRVTDELLITPCPDSMKLLIRRDHRDMTIMVKVFYLYELYEIQWSENERKEAYRIINDTIAYINLRYLEMSEVDSVMSQLLGMQKIIIDIRNYPHGVLYELSKYLNPAPTDFVKIFAPNIAMPGQFIRTLTMQTGDSNELYYKGELRLIVNEQTQSHAEFTAMCLQSAPNVITVGNTTAGTDGNVSYIFLPGGIRCSFTGIGIEYPDGTPTQRVGIKIDTVVRPGITDIKRKYDRLLEVAIEL